MFKFLHAADIHLDSPFQGLERYEGAPIEQMRQATRRAFANLVELALSEQVQFVLIAGDLYDRDWRDYGTGLFFVNQITRLRQANIPAFVIAGNHDAANKMTRTLRFQADVMLRTDEPQTCLLKDLGVAIHGQGFAAEAVTDDLSKKYPDPTPGYFNIGLLHTCANGRDGHARYAPCTIDGLVSKGYDYWALGHIHKREFLHEEPYIIFPGNVQGRHIGETGPKGCMLVTVHDNHHVEVEFRCVDVLRWERCDVDATEAESPDAVLARVVDNLVALRQESEGRTLAVRVEVRGSCRAHEQLLANPQKWINEIRSMAIETAAEELWIEKVKFNTTPPSTHVSLAVDGPFGELVAVIEELCADPRESRQLHEEFAELYRKLPPELKEGDDALRLDDPSWLKGILPRVKPLLLSRLLSRESPP
jgi:exonuclease SbcD